MAYDAQNRLVSTTDRLGGVTLSNYNCCQLVSIVDAENQMTAYAYNARGEKIRETLPDHVSGATVGTSGYGIVDFLYDEVGRIKRKTDQAGDTCTFNYDLAGRMFQRDYRTLANSPSGTIADSGKGKGSSDLLFGFGEVLETRSVDADGFTTRSLTDGAGRTLQTIDQLGKISTMTYDAAGNVLSARDPNGVGYDAVYGELGRMTLRPIRLAIRPVLRYDDEGEFCLRS